MSSIVRQSNLFAAEDFTKIYKSFQDIDFTAYDFDTIRGALIEYIKVHYPEDFNDYIESSEFIAIIELLAYLGTSLALRADINARENLLDTAERKESIVRLARMINYQPKRNLAANGLMKVSSIQTDQPVKDSVGNVLSNTQILWSDPNNPDWFDQFTSVLNAAFNPGNPFGRPSKSGVVGNIPTDLYQLADVTGLNVTYNVSTNINGEEIPIDIVNPDFENGETFFERHPDQSEQFNLIYRNDALGAASADTGFFVHFRQGKMEKFDERFDFPEPNRIWDVDVQNINNTDVFVQEVNDLGEVVTKWKNVPSVVGSNVIYNTLNFNERDIFEVISGLNDTVSIKFADGNFGNVPTGILRTWYRTSLGRKIVLRPEDVTNLSITIPYFGIDGQRYRLTVFFGLENSVSNGAEAETDEQIKTRAPQVYYTQDRMVNNEDYNVFPLTRGNEITKLRAINRTHSGHSRYIQSSDPTGFHQSLLVNGEDGALYNDDENQRTRFELTNELGSDTSFQVASALQSFMHNDKLENFYFNQYIVDFTNDNPGIFELKNVNIAGDPADTSKLNWWKTSPDSYKSNTGYFITENEDAIPAVTNWPLGVGTSGNYPNVRDTGLGAPAGSAYKYVTAGSTITFADALNPTKTISTSVKSVANFGQPFDPIITEIGPIELGTRINDRWRPFNVTPAFRSVFTQAEFDAIVDEIDNSSLFGLRYNVEIDLWEIIPGTNNLNEDDMYEFQNSSTDWFVLVKFIPGNANDNSFYEFISRGIVTVFESLASVRFYWDPEDVVFDNETGRALEDVISIMPNINNDSTGKPLAETVSWDLSGVFIQEDGFQDPAKIEVLPTDYNEDGTADRPTSFADLVATNDEVIFESFVDVDGYEKTRPWVSNWVKETESENVLFVDVFELAFNTDDPGIGAGTPIPNSGTIYNLDQGDLFIVNGITVTAQVLAAQLQTELNIPTKEVETEQFINIINTSKSIRHTIPGTDITKRNEFYHFTIGQVGETRTVTAVIDTAHFGKHGISFSQDFSEIPAHRTAYHFKWNHFVPSSQRVDPSPSNIIDTVVLTDLYHNDVQVWKNEGKTRAELPLPPTTEELRIQFSELEVFKSISDQLIYNSGKFKILFGSQAEPELQATFKAVKIPTANISNNEIKTRIIQAVDEYFDVTNWDFGERFYYTELAAYIHTQLSKFLSSVVIVPRKQESEFGDLFEIAARPSELFISTATVSDVEIVSNLTETNLRM